MGAMAEMDILRQSSQPAAPTGARRVVVKDVWVTVSFWWAGLDPERAFDVLRAADVQIQGRSTDRGRTWTQTKERTTLEGVMDWMLDKDLTRLDYDRLSQRRVGGTWEGLYAVQIGKRRIAWQK
jgi:hypothetical protein